MISLFKFWLWKLKAKLSGKKLSPFIDNKKLIKALKDVQG